VIKMKIDGIDYDPEMDAHYEFPTNTDDEFLNVENKFGKIIFFVVFGLIALCFLSIIGGGLAGIFGG